jgi:cell division protein FtsX
VYNNLERVALTKEMSRKERERILLDDVEKFKKLKEDILRRKEEAKEKEQASPEAPQQEIVAPEAQEPLPDSAVVPAHEPLAAALAEIKALIREEFRALRAEVKLWRDSR